MVVAEAKPAVPLWNILELPRYDHTYVVTTSFMIRVLYIDFILQCAQLVALTSGVGSGLSGREAARQGAAATDAARANPARDRWLLRLPVRQGGGGGGRRRATVGAWG